MRRAKVDRNHAEVVSALRAAGVSVQSLATVGDGCPDLLCGINGKNVLIEVKDGKKPPSAKRLRDSQLTWNVQWRGELPHLVESVEDALAVVKWSRG